MCAHTDASINSANVNIDVWLVSVVNITTYIGPIMMCVRNASGPQGRWHLLSVYHLKADNVM